MIIYVNDTITLLELRRRTPSTNVYGVPIEGYGSLQKNNIIIQKYILELK